MQNILPMELNLPSASKRTWWGSGGMLLSGIMLALGALLCVGFTENSLLSTLAVALFWGAVGTLLLVIEGTFGSFPKPSMRQFWATYSLRIFVMALLHIALSRTEYWPWWDFGSEGGDELLFWNSSERLIWAWQDGTIFHEVPFTNAFAWLHIISFIRFVSAKLGGETVFNVRLVLCMAGALIVPYVYAMTLRFFNKRVARTAAMVAFWLPDYWFYSSTLMRDVLVSCIMIIVFYQVVTLVYGRFSWWRLVLALGLNFLVMRYLRVDLAFVNAAIIGLLALWCKFDRHVGLSYRIVVIGLVGLLVLVILSTVAPQVYSLSALSSDQNLTGWYIDRRLSVERELGLEEAGQGSLGAILLNLPLYLAGPLQTILVILNPFPPWAVIYGQAMFPFKAMILLCSSLVWFGLLVFVPVGWLLCLKNEPRKTVWVWGTVLVLALLLGFSTSIQARWRLALMPFLSIILARGMVDWRQHRRLLCFTAACLTGMLVLYSVLKYLR